MKASNEVWSGASIILTTFIFFASTNEAPISVRFSGEYSLPNNVIMTDDSLSKNSFSYTTLIVVFWIVVSPFFLNAGNKDGKCP